MEWTAFINDTKSLARKIKEDYFAPDMLIAVARGGWIPTRLLSDYLDVKNIASIGVKYLDDERTKLFIYSHPTLPSITHNILIIEDMLESGSSIKWVQAYYDEIGYTTRTASVYITNKTSFFPDYYYKKLHINTKFPWEE